MNPIAQGISVSAGSLRAGRSPTVPPPALPPFRLPRAGVRILTTAAFALALTLFLAASASADQPALTIEPAANVSFASAQAKGTIDPEDHEGFWHFDYVSQEKFEVDGWAQASNANFDYFGISSEPFDAQATLNLAAATTYHLRLTAEPLDGEPAVSLEAPTFTTLAATAPTLTLDPPATVAYTTAGPFQGSVDPEGGNVDPGTGALPIHWAIELSQSADPGTWFAISEGDLTEAAAESSDPIDVPEAPAEAAGLSPDTTYHYRLRASYAGREQIAGGGPGDTFHTEAVQPPAVTIAASGPVTGTGAHLSGSVEVAGIDPAFEASCRFEYLTEQQFIDDGNAFPEPEGAPSVPCDPDLVAATEPAGPVDVEAELAGLEPNTKYHLRLVASNSGGQTSEEGAFETEAIPPTLAPEVSTPDGPGKVTLRAFVNPHNSTVTDCHFEFGLTTSYGQSAPCEGDPNGNAAVRMLSRPSELIPGATYHYRIVVDNGNGPAVQGQVQAVYVPDLPADGDCANTGSPGTGFLPDCRAYELVSPPDKNGGDILSDSQRTRAASDGGAIVYASKSAFGDARGTGIAVDFMAVRTAQPGGSGWTTHSLTPPQDGLKPELATEKGEANYPGELAPDLSRGVIYAPTPLTNDPSVANAANLYARSDLPSAGEGTYTLLTTCPLCISSGQPLPLDPVGSLDSVTPRLGGSTDDLTQVIFESNVNLTASAPPQPVTCPAVDARTCRPRAYEWDQGVLRLVGLVPPGGQASCGPGGPDCVPAELSVLGQSVGPGKARAVNVISADGSRVFFTLPMTDSGEIETNLKSTNVRGNIYMRKEAAETIQLNSSERTTPAAYSTATFLLASRNGEKVVFISRQALTDSSPDDGLLKLYMYDAARPASDPHNLTLLSVDAEPADGRGEVWNASAIGNNGSYVYFLAEGQNIFGGPANVVGGVKNLYLWHDGGLFRVGGLGGFEPREEFFSTIASVSSGPEARVSADGHIFLFATRDGSELATGQNLAGFLQMFIYNGARNELVCISCDRTAAQQSGAAEVNIHGSLSTATRASSQLSRAISDDGRFAFFSSAQALVAGDTNGAWDAYEYDTRTDSVYLLSSGTSSADSYFMDASADGRDVFITTRERLSGWDLDGSYDLYDVAVEGGLPEPAPRIAPCAGDSCRSAPPPLPAVEPTGSVSVVGPGDPPVRRCKKVHHRGSAAPRSAKRCPYPKTHRKPKKPKRGHGAGSDRKVER